MKSKMANTPLAVAAAVLLSGVVAASAASLSYSSSSSTMARPASDTLSLTTAQRKMAWKDLSTEASKQNLPAGFNANIGSVVPSTLKIEPVSGKTANDVPPLKPYDFAMVPASC